MLQHKPQDVDASQWKEVTPELIHFVLKISPDREHRLYGQVMEEIHSMTSKDKLSPVPVLGFSAIIERAEVNTNW